MKVRQGKSFNEDARTAVAEATASFGPEDLAPSMLVVFASTKQDPDALLAALAERFPGAPIAGCTTAGEMCDAEHSKGTVVLSAIYSPEIRWAVEAVEDLATVDARRAKEVADRLFASLSLSRDAVDPTKHFCLTFLDGLSMKEEQVVSLMADALEGLPLLGGSAGDDLGFSSTRVFANGKALRSAGVFVLAESRTGFEIVKHQHFTTTPRSLVITKADVATRRVYEMDGYPALEAYANALGLAQAAVTSDVSFMNPLTLSYDGDIYVRSIQRIESDGSIVFYCGIEEGMVLAIGGHEPMVAALERDLAVAEGKIPRADVLIACSCILRALEADKRQLFGPLGSALSAKATHVIGFDTYGEQLNGLHINQTLVGIALRGEAERS